ncbi:hypothetical protein [Caballeronia cordobensis]|uniref:hypothetical protein n=1 Tax=Caballeronia cordobensis TaxID=1353886 RepID=UPI00094F93C4|nr:hypothetical protein [Caballeronia cordobensis]
MALGFACFFRGACFGVGLLALPLPGAGVTFFAAAKKVTKESSFVTARAGVTFFAAAKKVTKESSFVTARGHTQFGHACQPTVALA